MTLLCCAPFSASATQSQQRPLLLEPTSLHMTTEKSTPDLSNLRILTQNCKLLLVVGEWPVMPITSGKRASLIAERLLKNNYDIIGLNEIFLKEPTAILKRELELNGYHVLSSLPAPSGIFAVNSGLMLASRLPIRASKFERYQKASGLDQYAAKGCLVAELETSDKAGRLFVAISHHQSEGSDEIMMSQFQHAGELIQQFVLERVGDNLAELERATVLYFGDMNVADHLTPKLYTDMKAALSHKTEDCFLTTNPEGTNGATFPVGKETDRLDYIFSLKEFSGVALNGSLVKSVQIDNLIWQDSDIPLSDHLGLIATLQLI
ncbi:hypothetical protein BCR33DRAFT_720155 [Rhizoclosmatium globosum]|uniref:Endonuclease/exonuclease/phosphatase domain-containing protein n=1 Tax=Rhizoclosmatium globosum TaxID=329046 RepID=A0A1Y2BX42_9FUNG|nr:hypothetical protein BCR33DRAFT_720155 [Rhizoclosmatium globosum]|eukprot:ORY39321.1 hypothetical protein BCR33DRAFT_720155 [Rhizoclosmatium globosum]